MGEFDLYKGMSEHDRDMMDMSSGPSGNSSGGRGSADELYDDDGRYSGGDSSEHGGDWGHHSDGDGHADVDMGDYWDNIPVYNGS